MKLLILVVSLFSSLSFAYTEAKEGQAAVFCMTGSESLPYLNRALLGDEIDVITAHGQVRFKRPFSVSTPAFINNAICVTITKQ